MRRTNAIFLVGALLPGAVAGAVPASAAEGAPSSREESLRRELRQVFDPSRILELVGILEDTGREEEAVELLLGAGEAALVRGRAEEAVELLERAVAIDPSRASLHTVLGRARLEVKRFEGALRALRRARQLGDEGRTLDILEAAALWETGNPEGAEAIYRDLAPASALARHQLGRLLLWTGRPSEAVDYLRGRNGRPPGSPDLRLDLARALEGAGELEEARRRYRELVEEIPGHTKATYGLGRVLTRLGRREEATRVLERYRELYLRDRERVRREGLTEGALAEARRRLEEGDPRAALDRLENGTDSPDALAIRASALRVLGRSRAAREALERAVTLAPDRDDLRARLLTLRLELGGSDP
ncbi:MAG: tetratricopeptide repeat protein [Thermoanaerobaculia bacterium]|nr:tetratricopeptide repeat protein [Thermoanaerobaculia bacterium]